MKRSQGVTFVGVALAAGLISCSLEPKSRNVRVHLDLTEVSRAYAERSLALAQGGHPAAKAAPSSLNGFHCLGVNIVGPGIPDSSLDPNQDHAQVAAGVLAGAYCSYRGVIAGPILPASGSYGPSELTLSVPSGANRVIQVVGIVDTRSGAPACAPGAGFANDQSNLSPKAEYYEISRAKLDLLSSQSVTLSNAWPSGGDAGRRINCDDGPVGAALAINNITTPVPSVTNMINWPITATVSGSYDEYCWQENNASVGSCSWNSGLIPSGVTIGGANETKILSFWVRNTTTNVTSDRYDMPATVLDTAAPIVSINTPNGGETLSASTHNIVWTSTDASAIAANGVTIEYSEDSGSTWSPVAVSIPNSGTHPWTLPNVTTSNARIRVTVLDVAGNSGVAVSTTDFTINNP